MHSHCLNEARYVIQNLNLPGKKSSMLFHGFTGLVVPLRTNIFLKAIALSLILNVQCSDFQEIRALKTSSFTGEPSLQNSIELALKSLKLLPSHATREILIIMGSLTTCDPGDISETIQVMIFVFQTYFMFT